jgi:hypothetical protein
MISGSKGAQHYGWKQGTDFRRVPEELLFLESEFQEEKKQRPISLLCCLSRLGPNLV